MDLEKFMGTEYEETLLVDGVLYTHRTNTPYLDLIDFFQQLNAMARQIAGKGILYISDEARDVSGNTLPKYKAVYIIPKYIQTLNRIEQILEQRGCSDFHDRSIFLEKFREKVFQILREDM